MNLSPTTSSTATSAVRASAPAAPPPGRDPFEVVSDLLGMTVDEISDAVSSGTSLADLADRQGVSRDELLQTLSDGAPADLQGTDALNGIVVEIADRTGGPSGRGGPGGPGGPGGRGGPPPPPPSGVMSGNLTESQSDLVEVLSDLLGTSSEDLLDQLQSGVSLTGLLADGGLSSEDVTSVIESGFLIDARF